MCQSLIGRVATDYNKELDSELRVSIPYRKGRNGKKMVNIKNLTPHVSIPYRKGRNKMNDKLAAELHECQSIIGRVATTVLSTVSGSKGLKNASFLPFFLVTQYTIFEIVFQHLFTEFRSPTRLLSPKSPC